MKNSYRFIFFGFSSKIKLLKIKFPFKVYHQLLIFLENYKVIPLTKQMEINQKQTKDYVRTTDQQKFSLIDLVINEKYSMKLASQVVGVKLSTVKYIIKAYKTNKQCFLDKIKSEKQSLQNQLREKKTQTKKLQKPKCKAKQQNIKQTSIVEQYSPVANTNYNNQLENYPFQYYITAQNFQLFLALMPQFNQFQQGFFY